MRLAGAYIQEVLAIREGGSYDPEELIHVFRITLKRQRAFWRLLSPVIPHEVFRRENARLRFAKRRLAAGRDEAAALKTMRKITLNARGGKAVDFSLKALSVLRRRMLRSRNREQALLAFTQVQSDLKTTLKRFEALSPTPRGMRLFEPGLAIAYRKARQTARITTNSGEEKFHHWRKRVKDLWYQLAAMHSIWPGLPLEKLLYRLDVLQELLGDEHDLALLKDALNRMPGRFGGSNSVKPVIKTIDFELVSKRSKAVRLGKKILGQKPGVFVNKMLVKAPPLQE